MLLYGTKTTLKLNVLRRRSLVIRVRKLSESGSIKGHCARKPDPGTALKFPNLGAHDLQAPA